MQLLSLLQHITGALRGGTVLVRLMEGNTCLVCRSVRGTADLLPVPGALQLCVAAIHPGPALQCHHWGFRDMVRCLRIHVPSP